VHRWLAPGMNRTHWAVKDVSLPKELHSARGITLPSWARDIGRSVDVSTHAFEVALSFPARRDRLSSRWRLNLSDVSVLRVVRRAGPTMFRRYRHGDLALATISRIPEDRRRRRDGERGRDGHRERHRRRATTERERTVADGSAFRSDPFPYAYRKHARDRACRSAKEHCELRCRFVRPSHRSTDGRFTMAMSWMRSSCPRRPIDLKRRQGPLVMSL
jgi:hypothetical protein